MNTNPIILVIIIIIFSLILGGLIGYGLGETNLNKKLCSLDKTYEELNIK